MSADSSRPAVVTQLSVTGSKGLVFQGLEFATSATAAAPSTPFAIRSSSDVTISGSDFHGSRDRDPTNDGDGLSVVDSARVTLVDNEFHDLRIGLGHRNADGLTVRGNDFHHIRLDGVRGGDSSDVLVEDNYFTSFFPISGDHADAIQFWTTGTTTAATGITIRGNVFERGTGASNVQGVFFNDELRTLPYRNVVISDNLVVGAQYNGIAVYGVSGAVLSGNIVGTIAGSKSWVGAFRSTGVQATGNWSAYYNGVDGSAGGNVVIPIVSDGGDALLDAWLARRDADVGTLSDGLLARLGLGAGLALTGTADRDTLFGTAADDTLNGSGGADVLVGGRGADALNGGDGYDEVSYSTATAGVTLNLATGVHRGDAAGDVFSGIERFSLSDYDDVFVGTDAVDLVKGGAGNDTLDGGGRSDKLYGGDGNDVFVASLGPYDRIMDFENGADRVRVDDAGVRSFAELKVTAVTGGVTVTWAGGAGGVTLVGVAASQVDASDFLFG